MIDISSRKNYIGVNALITVHTYVCIVQLYDALNGLDKIRSLLWLPVCVIFQDMVHRLALIICAIEWDSLTSCTAFTRRVNITVKGSD